MDGMSDDSFTNADFNNWMFHVCNGIFEIACQKLQIPLNTTDSYEDIFEKWVEYKKTNEQV